MVAVSRCARGPGIPALSGLAAAETAAPRPTSPWLLNLRKFGFRLFRLFRWLRELHTFEAPEKFFDFRAGSLQQAPLLLGGLILRHKPAPASCHPPFSSAAGTELLGGFPNSLAILPPLPGI